MYRQLFLLIILSFVVSQTALGQELNATVTADYRNLPVMNKESLIRFAEDIQTYLNSNKFSGADWSYDRINCTFNIAVATAQDEVNYTGQIVVTSQRKIYKSLDFSPMLRVFDNTWNFAYEKNQTFYYNPQVFNSITSLLNYYALLIIGLECDSWEKLSGTTFFSRASDISLMAQSSSTSSGWISNTGNFNRRDLVENLLSEKYRVIREGVGDYHYAIDMYAQKNINTAKRDVYVQKSQEKIIAFLKLLESLQSKIESRSLYLRTFFDAKYGEIIDRLRGLKDKDIYKTLKLIDPAHTAKYDEAMKNP